MYHLNMFLIAGCLYHPQTGFHDLWLIFGSLNIYLSSPTPPRFALSTGDVTGEAGQHSAAWQYDLSQFLEWDSSCRGATSLQALLGWFPTKPSWVWWVCVCVCVPKGGGYIKEFLLGCLKGESADGSRNLVVVFGGISDLDFRLESGILR